MNIDNFATPYFSHLITKTILFKVCSGNLKLRYGVESLKTGKQFKGLAALVLGHHVAENNIDAYKFATFAQIESLYVLLEKGSKGVAVPMLSKSNNLNKMKLMTASFFGTHQIFGYKCETRPKFNLEKFYKKYSLNQSNSDFYLDLVHFIEQRIPDHKHTDVVYNLVSAYFSDILSLNIPQKNVEHFYGRINLTDTRNCVLLANQIVGEAVMDCKDVFCSKNESSAHIAKIKSLIKS